jgi:hypothetical protein
MGALTQGFAKPPPWAESCNRFAVNPTGSQTIRIPKFLDADA